MWHEWIVTVKCSKNTHGIKNECCYCVGVALCAVTSHWFTLVEAMESSGGYLGALGFGAFELCEQRSLAFE